MTEYVNVYVGYTDIINNNNRKRVDFGFIPKDRKPEEYPCSAGYFIQAASIVSHALELIGARIEVNFAGAWSSVNKTYLYVCRATSIGYTLPDGCPVAAESGEFIVIANNPAEARKKGLAALNPFGDTRLNIEMEVKRYV